MKVLAFGEVLWDFINGDKYFGGAPLNFAAHVIKSGGESAIVTALGDDKFGDDALLGIQELGIKDEFVQRVPGMVTGRVMVFLINDQPSYRITKDVAYDHIDESKLQIARITEYDAFYFGTLSQRSEKTRQALYHILKNQRFKHVFYDVNLRKECYTMENVRESLKYCTILKLNDEELTECSKLLFGKQQDVKDFVIKIQSEFNNVKIILITYGDQGCTLITDKEYYDVPGNAIELKDAVGAGDAFCAGFLTTYMRTNDPRKSVRIGNLIGSYVASENGAVPEYTAAFARKIEILGNQ